MLDEEMKEAFELDDDDIEETQIPTDSEENIGNIKISVDVVAKLMVFQVCIKHLSARLHRSL